MLLAMGKHSEWRKIAKKFRRKRIRQEIAKHRDKLIEAEKFEREKSPSFQTWLREEEKREQFELEEEELIRQKQEDEWCRIEVEAQKQWRELQKKLEVAREERAKQNARIKLEWEQEQKKLQDLKEQKELEIQEKRVAIEQRNQEIEDFLEGGGETPEHLKVAFETNPNKELCPFFQKTSACRFFDACSRNHKRPGVSHIIVVTNFYSHYSLEKTSENEHGSDNNLEFEKEETYNHFRDFFYDVMPEMEKCGRIIHFQVCCNHESHLRGNVYVEYDSTRAALKSYKTFNGRWYGGKQLNVEFCGFDSWRNAICGLYFSNRCPKGSACNFLHVFRNPKNLYNYDSYHQLQEYKNGDRRNASDRRDWRWSESPERIILSNTSKEKSRHNSHGKTRTRSREDKCNNSSKRKRSSSRSKNSKRSNISSRRSKRKRSRSP